MRSLENRRARAIQRAGGRQPAVWRAHRLASRRNCGPASLAKLGLQKRRESRHVTEQQATSGALLHEPPIPSIFLMAWPVRTYRRCATLPPSATRRYRDKSILASHVHRPREVAVPP